MDTYLTGLSIAYQLRNDLTDVVDARENYLRPGNDLAERNLNFLISNAFHAADSTHRLRRWWDDRSDTEEFGPQELVSVIESTGSIRRANRYIRRSIDVSGACLQEIRDIDPDVRRVLERALVFAGTDPRTNVSRGVWYDDDGQ